MNKYLIDSDLSTKIRCDSAGLGNWHSGELPDKRARKVAENNGLTLTHLARQIEINDYKTFEYIICMDKAVYKEVINRKPNFNAISTITLMGDFDIFEPNGKPTGRDVIDPYTGDLRDFEGVFDMLQRCCHHLLEHIISKNNGF